MLVSIRKQHILRIQIRCETCVSFYVFKSDFKFITQPLVKVCSSLILEKFVLISLYFKFCFLADLKCGR